MNYYIYCIFGISTLYIFKYEFINIFNIFYNSLYYKFYNDIKIINNDNIELVNCINCYILDNNTKQNNLILSYKYDKKLQYKPGYGKYYIKGIHFNIDKNFTILTSKNNDIESVHNIIEEIINKYYNEIITVESMELSYIIPILDDN